MEAAAAALEASALGAFMRASGWAYPAANVLHLLGLVLLVGGTGILDLRIAGAFRALPLPALSRALTPLAIIGLILQAATGALMFAADAGALIHSPLLRWKLALIAIAVANALLFRLLGRGRAEEAVPSAAQRLTAVASLGLWLTVAALGRLIAYR